MSQNDERLTFEFNIGDTSRDNILKSNNNRYLQGTEKEERDTFSYTERENTMKDILIGKAKGLIVDLKSELIRYKEDNDELRKKNVELIEEVQTISRQKIQLDEKLRGRNNSARIESEEIKNVPEYQKIIDSNLISC